MHRSNFLNRTIAAPWAFVMLATTAFAGAPSITGVSAFPVVSGTVGTTFNVPVGKTLVLPVTGEDPDNDVVSYSVTSNLPAVRAQIRTGNPSMRIAVSHGADSNGPAFNGTLELMLFRDLVPRTAGIIAGLAQAGFYDGLTFHRISAANSAIQGGDPNGNGTGGPGFKYDNEYHPALIFSGSGQVGMANSGFDANFRGTNGSQFFITPDSPRGYSFNYTIFGQLVRGWNLIPLILNVETNANDKPVVPLVMDSVTVAPCTTDAVLFLATTGTGSATLTLIASDGTNSSAPVSIQVNAVPDATNDPPILAPVPDRSVKQSQTARFKLRGTDLEGDYLEYAGGPNDSHSTTNIENAVLLASPNPANYIGVSAIAMGVKQYGAATRGSSSFLYDPQTALAAFGVKKLKAAAGRVVGPSGTVLNPVVAIVTDTNTATTADQLKATINWGDGTPLTTGSNELIAPDPTASDANRFLVSGTHAYAEPGIYPVMVEVTGTSGNRARIITRACISDTPLVGEGVTLKAPGGHVRNKPVATFTDAAPGATVDYKAVIDWGDGQHTAGTVSDAGNGTFVVRGSHTYADNGPYAVCVMLERPGAEGIAWSDATVSGIPRQSLPPFKLANLVSSWNNSLRQVFTVHGPFLRYTLTGSFVVLNSGSKNLSNAKVRFYLSDDNVLDHGTDLPLSLANGSKTVPLPTLPAKGGGVTLTIAGPTRLQLPGLATGKYVIAHLLYSDPITDHLAVRKIYASQIPPP